MVSSEGYRHVDSMRCPSHAASEPLGAKLRYPHHCLLMVAKGVAGTEMEEIQGRGIWG